MTKSILFILDNPKYDCDVLKKRKPNTFKASRKKNNLDMVFIFFWTISIIMYFNPIKQIINNALTEIIEPTS